MKLTKRIAAVILTVIMALSAPVFALAEGTDANFTLTVNTTKLFAGMAYDVVASITDASKSTATGNDKYTWSISASSGETSITSKNNYSAKQNDGETTYTVTETASFIMPAAGATATITAKLGDRTKTVTVNSLQPIESYTVNFTNNDHAYYDNTNNTVYLDRMADEVSNTEFMDFTVSNINPSVNDDSIELGQSGFAYNKVSAAYNAFDDKYRLTAQKDAAGVKGALTFSTISGKSPKSYNLQICVPLTSYKLNVKRFGDTKYSQFAEVSDAVGVKPALSTVAGKEFSINITKGNSGSNDQMSYTLYTDEELKNKALDKYYSVSDDVCDISIDIAGTYYLECKNVSIDNGKLVRDELGSAVVKIIVNQAYPIQTINLYKLDEQSVQTDKTLESLVLYTNASADKSTYALENSVSVTPKDNTDSIYYLSSDSKIAKVDEKTGLITAVAKGNTTVWVRSADNPEAIASVNVEVKIGVKSITGIVNTDGVTDIPSGHIARFSAVTNPSEVDDIIYWSTSNPELLTINPTTGIANASSVSSKTPVDVIATTESGKSQRVPFNVVPAVRATSVKLTVTSSSTTMTEEQSGAYKLYKDYNTKKPKPFIVEAQLEGENNQPSNDKLLWTVSYDNGVGMSIEDAREAGYLSYTKNSEASYSIMPLKTELFTITCVATLNETRPQTDDKFDVVMLKLNDTATSIKVVDESTGNDAAGTVNIPIGKTLDFTVKTSTASNDKKADPPKMEITAGAEYVSVTSKPSADGEGVTYSIKGLKYGLAVTKIKFSSTSDSVNKTISFPVRNNIASAEVSGCESSVAYTGKAITFNNIVLKVNGSSLDTAQYAVTYKDNVNVGTATITFTGKNEYLGSIKVFNFSITPLSLSNAEIADIAKQTLGADNKAITPATTVKVNSTVLRRDRDYVVSYTNNTRAGTATATITGMGNYVGTARKNFTVIDDINKCSISGIALQSFTGGPRKPSPVIKYFGRTLKKDTDYTLTYINNINVGVASVRIEGKGLFKGSVTKTFIIRPKRAAIKSLKKAKKAFTLKWSPQTNIAGYQIQYALNSKFTKSKKTKSVLNGVRSYKATKLKGKKKYYVRVRSYAIINGVKYYGDWSPVKKVKTK